LYVVIATKPLFSMHLYMVLASHPYHYAKVEGNPYWEATMNEEYNSLIENQN
jgi:hypothetical protein